MTTTSITHPTEAICPSWCAGHEDQYQGWERRVADGVLQRDHAERGVVIAGTHVYVNQVEDVIKGVLTAVGVVTADDLRLDHEMTQAEAHELGMALVRAGDVIRRAARR